MMDKFKFRSVERVHEFFVISCFVLFGLISFSQANSPEYRIRQEIFNSTYSKRVRPPAPVGTPVDVQITLNFYALLNLNEKAQTLTSLSWIIVDWKDTRLQWNPDEYESLYHMSIYVDEVWVPKILIENSIDVDETDIIAADRGIIILYSDGTLSYAARIVQTTLCDIKTAYFPFDIQRCNVAIATQNIPIDEIHLTYGEFFIDSESLISSQWALTDGEIGEYNVSVPTADHKPMSFQVLEFTYVLERDSSYFVITLLIPSLLLILISLLTFLTPPDCGERITIGMSVVLGLTVFQLVVNETLPPSKGGLPLIASFLAGNFFIAFVTIILSIFSISIAYGDRPIRIKSRFGRKIVFDILPKCLLLPTLKQRIGDRETKEPKVAPDEGDELILADMEPNETVLTECSNANGTRSSLKYRRKPKHVTQPRVELNDVEKLRMEYRAIAVVFDRLMFIIFSAALFLFFVYMGLVLPFGAKEELARNAK